MGLSGESLAGDRFHPLVYAAYAHLIPAAFTAVLESGETLNGSDFNFEHGDYEANHIYAFWRMGWSGDWLAENWARIHSAEASHSANVQLLGPNLGAPNAFMMSLLGNEDIPVALGGWEPGVVERANYLRGSGELRLHLRGVVGDTTELRVIAAEPPLQATVNGEPLSWNYDPLWDVVTLKLANGGLQAVTLAFPFQGADPPAPVPPDSNLALNPGFEESGVGVPNYNRPWDLYRAVGSRAVVDTTHHHSGRSALRLHAYSPPDTLSLYQNIYFGEENAYTVSFYYDIPLEIPENSFWVSVQDFQDQHNAGSHPRTFSVPPEQNPSDGWQQMQIEIPVDDVRELPGAAICRLGFNLRGAAGRSVYIDDVALYSPFLTTPCDLSLQVVTHPEFVWAGGVLHFELQVGNLWASPLTLDELTLDTRGPLEHTLSLYQRAPLEIPSGGTQTATIRVPVPAAVPHGFYDVTLTISRLGEAIAADGFPLEVR
jgi:hypothetical protein